MDLRNEKGNNRMLDVCLLGTGGMMPLPNRWLTALMTRCNGSSLLIDCGEGTQVAIREKGWSVHDLDCICITHFHGDHISGLPGLLLSMGNADRTEPVTVIGPKGLERVVNALRIIAPELPFELVFQEITEEEQMFCINDYEIDAFRVQHNIICYGYRIRIRRGGRFYVEKAKENQVPMKLWSRLQKGEEILEDGILYSPSMVLGEERKGITLTYCTDTRPVKRIEEYAKEADLFICEGMYGEDEKLAKAKEHRHMTFSEAANLARNAKPKELWLTHYSPSLIHPEQYLEKTREIFQNTRTIRDKRTVTLEFEEEPS